MNQPKRQDISTEGREQGKGRRGKYLRNKDQSGNKKLGGRGENP